MTEHFPRQFGKYVLLKSLARGGMGEIYLAASGQPGGLNKLCVIKKVIAGKTDRAKVNRFLDEAKVVLRLSHGNLVSTFDAGDVRGELFIAMELVEGKDLREIWNRCVRTRTRIPVDVALVAVREVARALAYVHSYGGLRLVHRDVAPPNILLSYFGEVKLTDFGLARSILKQEHTAPGVVFGRASYLAPEQARGEVADARTDVYSLGIVLWELLTGQPYLQLAGLDPVTSLSLVRHPKAQPPSSRAPWIGPELDAVVLRALAADRPNRYQSAEELRRGLSEVMSRVAPRADAERVAEFLRGLYRDVVTEESAERERLLSQIVPRFRGEHLPEASTPRTDVFPPVAGGGGTGSSPAAQSGGAPGGRPEQGTTLVAASLEGPTLSRLADMPKESLHVSALRARAGSQVRRPLNEGSRSRDRSSAGSSDRSGADAPTKVWRKGRGLRGQDAAQTFVGRVIDNRYRINHRIGEGGMGTVYAAEHVEIGKSVAVKILHRIFSGEEQLVERFKREARAASRVGHPHIIEVTDFGTTEEGCAYFVMELLEGMDLADVLVREGKLDPARAVRIAAQICQALEAAHSSGIIHRDLKPENIFLVARDGQADFVKVLDFGIARNLSGESRRLTNPGMAMGTPEYMAPEQSQGRPADRRSDVYAVGALLHEMVTGAAPFQSESQQEMLEAKRRPLASLRESHPDVPASLDAVILRALAPDPERRPQTMALLEYELGKIVWGRPQAVADLLGLKETTGESLEAPPPARDADARADADRASARWKASDGGALPGPPTPPPRALPDGDSETPPPPLANSDRQVAAAGRAASGTMTDFEKLLEAELSPAPVPVTAPESRASSGAPLPSRRASSNGAAPQQQPSGAAPWSATLASTLPGLGDARLADERTLGIDSGVENPGVRVASGVLSGPPRSTPPSGPRFSPARPSPTGLSATDLSISGTSAAGTSMPGATFVPAFTPSAPAPDLRKRSSVALMVPVLAVVAGATAWANTSAGSTLTRGWARWLRDRIETVRAAPGAAVARATSRQVAATPAATRPIVTTLPAPSAGVPVVESFSSRGGAGSAVRGGDSSRAGAAVAPASPSTVPVAVAAAAPPSAPVSPVPAPGSPVPAAARHGAPEIVQMSPLERARTALAAGLPDDAIAVLRPAAARGNAAAKPLLADALVASGWNDVKVYRWNVAGRKAREALALAEPDGPSRGGHALLGEAEYALGDFNGAMAEFTKALAESPHDARLKRRVIRSRRQLHRPAAEPAAEAGSLTSEAASE